MEATDSDVFEDVFEGFLPGPCEDETGPLEFHDYDFTGIHEYSALRFAEFRVTLGGRGQVADHVGIFGEATFLDLEDDTQYLLQDVTGSVVLLTGGISWLF